LSADIRAASSSYNNLLKGGLKEEDWHEAKKKVVGADGMLLVYHLGPTDGELFVVTPEGVDCTKLTLSADAAWEFRLAAGPLSGAVALDLVNRYLQGAPMKDARGAPPKLLVGEPLTDAQAALLAEIVLPETVRRQIRERRPSMVTVAPDGALHRLPLEALPLDDKGEKYLIDDDAIGPLAYAPSVMVMAALMPQDPRAITWPPSVLTVGDAQYARAELAPLPWSAEECRGWERLLSDGDSRNVQALLQASATERNVKANIDGKRWVHFAVHGVIDNRADSVFAASLALTPGPQAPGEDRPPEDDDGSLNLAEVHRLPLAQCEVAVISACESNVGHTRKLEAGSTLTRAFLSAGARRVVSSMWRVNDEATATLMSEFAAALAEALKAGQDPIQQARRKIRADQRRPEWRRPHYWAPFVLIGPAT
jgi:CHAT domain-containing protein